VETPRIVALDDETRFTTTFLAATEGLRRAFPVPFPPVLVEIHLWIVAMDATLSLPTGPKCENFPAQKDLESGDKPVEGVERVV
jgi:hypothetical protein